MKPGEFEILLDFDTETGKTAVSISGIKGKRCGPIFKALSDSLTQLGLDETHHGDTPELYEREEYVSVNNPNRIRG